MRRIRRRNVTEGEEDGMPKRRAGRVRRSEDQWTEILRRFASSGQTSREFCRREGLALSSLQRWGRRLGALPRARFVELVPEAGARTGAAGWSLEVTLPHGVTLRVEG